MPESGQAGVPAATEGHAVSAFRCWSNEPTRGVRNEAKRDLAHLTGAEDEPTYWESISSPPGSRPRSIAGINPRPP